MNLGRREALDRICESFGLLAVYLFGSRVTDGLRFLEGEDVSQEGSDLEAGICFRGHPDDPVIPSELQAELGAIFAPLRVKLIAIEQLDSLSQFDVIEGHRVAAPDSTAANNFELFVMNMAEEMLWIKRQSESEDGPFSPC